MSRRVRIYVPKTNQPTNQNKKEKCLTSKACGDRTLDLGVGTKRRELKELQVKTERVRDTFHPCGRGRVVRRGTDMKDLVGSRCFEKDEERRGQRAKTDVEA